MNRTIEATGKDVAEATRKALRQLGVAKKDAKVTILDEGRKGFLGLFGGSSPVAFLCSDSSFLGSDHDRPKGDDEQDDSSGRGHTPHQRLVPPRPDGDAMGQRGAPCLDRFVFEEVTHIVSQLVR